MFWLSVVHKVLLFLAVCRSCPTWCVGNSKERGWSISWKCTFGKTAVKSSLWVCQQSCQNKNSNRYIYHLLKLSILHLQPPLPMCHHNRPASAVQVLWNNFSAVEKFKLLKLKIIKWGFLKFLLSRLFLFSFLFCAVFGALIV